MIPVGKGSHGCIFGSVVFGRNRKLQQAGSGGVSHLHVSRAGLERGLRVTNVAWAKNSCYGRELGTEGIDSYTVSQSISAAAAVN
jgi:hypothetical protein